jgi:hypothetical protein
MKYTNSKSTKPRLQPKPSTHRRTTTYFRLARYAELDEFYKTAIASPTIEMTTAFHLPIVNELGSDKNVQKEWILYCLRTMKQANAFELRSLTVLLHRLQEEAKDGVVYIQSEPIDVKIKEHLTRLGVNCKGRSSIPMSSLILYGHLLDVLKHLDIAL